MTLRRINPEQRNSNIFCVLMGKSRQKALSIIQSTYGATGMSRTRIYDRYNTFEIDPTHNADRRLTVRDIALKVTEDCLQRHRIRSKWH